MTNTRTTDRGTTWHAVVGVRVPATDSGDLAACASRRLARAEGVDVATTTLRAIEPALAATAVTVEAEVTTAERLDDEGIAAALRDAPGVQRVDEVRAASE